MAVIVIIDVVMTADVIVTNDAVNAAALVKVPKSGSSRNKHPDRCGL